MLNKKQELYEILLWYLRNLKKLKKTLKSVFKKSEKRKRRKKKKKRVICERAIEKITHLCWEEKSKREFNSFEVEKNSLFF